MIMKTKTINGKEYVSLEELKKFLEHILNENKKDNEKEDFNFGWESCIDTISDNLNLMVGFGMNERRKNAKKKS